VSASKVSTQPLPPEELAHLVDVSVARKYVTDLAQLTHVLAEDVHHTLDSFMHDLDDNLPRQIRSVVKEVIGNTQGNQAADTARTATQQATLPHEGYRTTQPANQNFQHPYYQATTYEPMFPNGVGNTLCRPWLEVCPQVPNNMHLMLNTDWATSGEMSDSVRELNRWARH
jgi:hypothetical protein